jgi:hypothetical protein
VSGSPERFVNPWVGTGFALGLRVPAQSVELVDDRLGHPSTFLGPYVGPDDGVHDVVERAGHVTAH